MRSSEDIEERKRRKRKKRKRKSERERMLVMVTQCRYGTISMVELSVYSIITSSYLLSNFLHTDRSFTSAVVLGTSFTEASRKTNTRIVLCLFGSHDVYGHEEFRTASVRRVGLLELARRRRKERRTTHWGGGGRGGVCTNILFASLLLFALCTFVAQGLRYATHHETLISTSLT